MKKINNIEKIGIDVGGTYIKAGLVEENNIKISIKFKTPKKQKEIIEKILFICEILKTSKTKLVGIGLPSKIINGKIAYSNNIDLKKIDLKKVIEKEVKMPVYIQNDANCFVLAETIYGQGKNYNNVVGLTLGTGIGAGLVINQKNYSGRGNAFEIGDSLISSKTVEEYIGKDNFLKKAKKFGLKVNEPKDLFNLANKKDKKAIELWNFYGNILGKTIVNIIHNVDPEIIIIGGNISNAWKFFSKEMIKTVNDNTSLKPCKIVKSKLENSGLIGCTLLSL
jgi:glucokinase